MGNEEIDRLMEISRELKAKGMYWDQAIDMASLEVRISKWPESWGDEFPILIFGDFAPPDGVIELPSLGIKVFPEKIENTGMTCGTSVLKASVRVQERSVLALIEAGSRINVFLGAFTLVTWGNVGCGWWSWLIRNIESRLVTKLAHDDLPRAVDGILHLRPEVRQKVDAALYWVREPKTLLMEFYRSGVLRLYSSYWNAFECLVEAVIAMRPMPKSDRGNRQKLLDAFISNRTGPITLGDVEDCYRTIVNPGFVGKATYALQVCFGEAAAHYVDECFKQPDKKNRLYDVRNAINHGDVDAENPKELFRVESRLCQLRFIIWGMFGCLVPFHAPVDPELQTHSS